MHLASQTSLGLLYDDPNKVQEVENIIMDFYNGMTRGSFKRGLETPRCGFMLACNFSLGKIQRYVGHTMKLCIYTQTLEMLKLRNLLMGKWSFKIILCVLLQHWLAFFNYFHDKPRGM